VFLHGAGERGQRGFRELWRVRTHGPLQPKVIKAGYVDSFLIVAPQCPLGKSWPVLRQELVQFIDEVLRHFPVDRTRVYGTGLSMGGFGIWTLAAERPTLFAAVAPICGAITPSLPHETAFSEVLQWAKRQPPAEQVAKLQHLPAWLFHGEKDKTVSVEGSRRAFEALGGEQRAERELRQTIFPHLGHSCWASAYSFGGLYAWLQQHRSLSEEGPAGEPRGRKRSAEEAELSTAEA